MQHLNTILRQLAKEYGIEGGEALNSLRRRWFSLVGKAVAAHTFPEALKNRVLTVVVDTPQWMHHLSFFKQDISDRIASPEVREIRFRIGRIKQKAGEQPGTDSVKLSDRDMRYIEGIVQDIPDEDLRLKFRSLMMHGLAARVKKKGPQPE